MDKFLDIGSKTSENVLKRRAKKSLNSQHIDISIFQFLFPFLFILISYDTLHEQTINYARENVIDFTKPFMNLGIGILFKVSTFLCYSFF